MIFNHLNIAMCSHDICDDNTWVLDSTLIYLPKSHCLLAVCHHSYDEGMRSFLLDMSYRERTAIMTTSLHMHTIHT